jgi:hypothetical protein
MDAAALQARIDAALRDPLTGAPKLRFTPYLLVVATELQDKLEAASRQGGVPAILDEFERLLQHENPQLLRRALANVLFYHPQAAALGLRVPM